MARRISDEDDDDNDNNVIAATPAPPFMDGALNLRFFSSPTLNFAVQVRRHILHTN